MNIYLFLKSLTTVDDVLIKCLQLLTLIIIASTFDWFFGWVNAKFNKTAEFVSDIALYGIIKKMMYFMVLVLFLVIALIILPETIAYSTVFALYFGFLWSEINSLMGHFGLSEDGKKGEVFIDFINKVFSNKEE